MRQSKRVLINAFAPDGRYDAEGALNAANRKGDCLSARPVQPLKVVYADYTWRPRAERAQAIEQPTRNRPWVDYAIRSRLSQHHRAEGLTLRIWQSRVKSLVDLSQEIGDRRIAEPSLRSGRAARDDVIAALLGSL